MQHEKIKHLDLFSGIGGFALAAETAFGKENIQHVFCDNDPFSQAILKKHWPNSPIYGDIRQLTTDADRKRELQPKGGLEEIRDWARDGVELLTGGFPCQPFSAAGRRRGTADDRHLWPEMLRVVRETNPHFILGENVGGLLTWNNGMVLDQVFADLEVAGYEVGAFVVPACAVNAPHRRDRVWIAAHARRCDARGYAGEHASPREEEWLPERDEVEQLSEPSSLRDAAHAGYQGLEGREREQSSGHGGQRDRSSGTKRRRWSEDWPEVAARLCTLDDGLPDGLARPRGWRNAALKGAGNAIVPQVAAEILKAMKETHGGY